jgi:light-regulated signal transduction histidine kinase (bacteriophytochrome)/CheY-like chemotaxis protein
LLPKSARPLDLSLAMTRAISPVHIEYLKNMGVSASLSVSIIVDGKLWGLITCHSRAARLPDYGHRTAAELFGHIFSITLESWLKQSQIDMDEKAHASIERMSRAIAGNSELLADASWLQDTIREVIDCDGVASLMSDRVQSCGSVPASSEIRAITGALAGNLFVTNHLPTFRPAAAVYTSEAAGMLAIPISSSPRDYILLFRREQRRDIQWAGNPTKAVIASEDGMRISPRKSFNAFLETVRGRSRPFTPHERRAAEAIRSSLIDVIARSPVGSEENRKSFERQELLIAELNHRVRNILSLIRGLISQSNGNQQDIAGYVDSLNGRVHAIARAHDQITKQNWGPGRLSELLEGEILAYIPERRERFSLVGEPLSLVPMAFSTFSLVIHELVTNSAKYGALSDGGRVEVTVEHRPGAGVDIRWRETEGPTVTPPKRRGFGSVIIERMVPFDLQGTATVRYIAAGLEADFFIPEKYIAADMASQGDDEVDQPTAEAQLADSPPSLTPLSGYNVLLVEDNMIIALESEHLLRDLGARKIFTASTESAAEQILNAETVDFALLDVHLGQGTSIGFAEQLVSARVPFIFASGYGENVLLGERHRTSVTVMKPFNRGTLRRAILRCEDSKRFFDACENSAENSIAAPG